MRKKKRKTETHDDLRLEYDLSKLKLVGRGIYAERYGFGPNKVVLLEESGKVDLEKKPEDDDLLPEYDFSKMRVVACGPARKLISTRKGKEGATK